MDTQWLLKVNLRHWLLDSLLHTDDDWRHGHTVVNKTNTSTFIKEEQEGLRRFLQ